MEARERERERKNDQQRGGIDCIQKEVELREQAREKVRKTKNLRKTNSLIRKSPVAISVRF